MINSITKARKCSIFILFKFKSISKTRAALDPSSVTLRTTKRLHLLLIILKCIWFTAITAYWKIVICDYICFQIFIEMLWSIGIHQWFTRAVKVFNALRSGHTACNFTLSLLLLSFGELGRVDRKLIVFFV